MGDRVLKWIARRCQEGVRSVDLIGRLGGEEFAVLLPETGVEAAGCKAERLRALIADEAVHTEWGSISVTVSVGVAAKSDPDPSLEELFAWADEALDMAKQSGRNCVRVHGDRAPFSGGSRHQLDGG